MVKPVNGENAERWTCLLRRRWARTHASQKDAHTVPLCHIRRAKPRVLNAAAHVPYRSCAVRRSTDGIPRTHAPGSLCSTSLGMRSVDQQGMQRRRNRLGTGG